MLPLFAAAIFVSAFLLFMVQPMAAKGILPLLGGSPSVWNTCMVFFQALLLAGYAYAHGLSSLKSRRTQVIIHVLVIVATGALLPIAVPQGWTPPKESGQSLWLLKLLTVMVGGPFFLLATTGPLMQSWFSRTGHKAASDPYFLYAASNAGSFLGLLGYPFLVEPLFGLRTQGWIWAGGFAVLAPLLIMCGMVSAKRSRSAIPAPLAPTGDAQPGAISDAPLTWRRRCWWVFLAFVPSSLVLGTTQYLSTDIAAIPLLWVVPLSIYLLTFVIAFSKHELLPARSLSKVLPYVVAALTIAAMIKARQPVAVLVGIHVMMLFLGATLCHKRLADARPGVSRLTEFYLWIAVGGVLGGAFNALAAPVIFNDVIEYPLAIGLACLARYGLTGRSSAVQIPWKYVWSAGAIAIIIAVLLSQTFFTGGGETVLICVVAAVALGVALQVGERLSSRRSGAARTRHRAGVVLDIVLATGIIALAIRGAPAIEWMLGQFNYKPKTNFWPDIVRVCIPCLLCILTLRHPLRFALSSVGILITSLYLNEIGVKVIHQERTFFGVLRVVTTGGGVVHLIRHGTTTHGVQIFHPDLIRMPTVYYHHDGPFGDIMYVYNDRPVLQRMAVIGMGVGGIAAYGRPGRSIDFYEIDPAVQRIAMNPDWFTYVRDSQARINVIIGDGRRAIAEVPDGTYGTIIVDAFSSDSIPLHLITREAAQVYLSKLAPDGLLIFHISNRHIFLDPPLVGIGDSLRLNVLVCKDFHDDSDISEPWSSQWVVMARHRADIEPLMAPGEDRRMWVRGLPNERTPIWTDDHANVIAQFKELHRNE